MMKGWDKGKFEFRHALESVPVNIVADAAVATASVSEGRLIPLVILDTSQRSDIEELVRVHKYLPLGDVVCQWAKLKGRDGYISLLLSFKRPAELTIILEFEISRNGILVEQILESHALYIQPGREGDRFANTLESPRILIYLPDMMFKKEWKEIFLKYIREDLRKRGLKSQQAKEAARQFIEEWRKFSGFRMT